MSAEVKKNVLGGMLQSCCHSPKTGYFRDGYCRTDDTDFGSHVICAEVTAGFLEFSKSRGNDLTTPRPEYNFPGLSPGDRWCLCALRWKEAFEAANSFDKDAVRDAIAAVEMETFYGDVKFGPDGNNIAKPMFLRQIGSDGSYNLVQTFNDLDYPRNVSY